MLGVMRSSRETEMTSKPLYAPCATLFFFFLFIYFMFICIGCKAELQGDRDDLDAALCSVCSRHTLTLAL